jgi:hypothetical protein
VRIVASGHRDLDRTGATLAVTGVDASTSPSMEIRCGG